MTGCFLFGCIDRLHAGLTPLPSCRLLRILIYLYGALLYFFLQTLLVLFEEGLHLLSRYYDIVKARNPHLTVAVTGCKQHEGSVDSLDHEGELEGLALAALNLLVLHELVEDDHLLNVAERNYLHFLGPIFGGPVVCRLHVF